MYSMVLQQLVLEYSGQDFRDKVNKLLYEGWMATPEFNLYVNNEDGAYLVLLQKDDGK
jgi:hypothetical protein